MLFRGDNMLSESIEPAKKKRKIVSVRELISFPKWALTTDASILVRKIFGGAHNFLGISDYIYTRRKYVFMVVVHI